jgi:putative Ca2+/H+ antiporter (TMEM165/GDT1 family)
MIRSRTWQLMVVVFGLLLQSSIARTHLMVAQKGTLNVSGNGAYLVISVPISGLGDVDDNHDGLLSGVELSTHSDRIRGKLGAGLQLNASNGALPLEGLMLHLAPPDGSEGLPSEQLVVMGRYSLDSKPRESLRFTCRLWGNSASTQSLSLTVTQNLKDARVLMLTSGNPTAELYPSTLSVFFSFLQHGAHHVAVGLDHLLFLLVAIAAGLRFRKLVVVLSVFTLGHAVSVTAVVVGGLTVPARIVEPAIAVTITALALYDVLSRDGRDPDSATSRWRLLLVFACSLIHGLGLGSALSTLGLLPSQQGSTLLGFNLGVELAQLSVAVVAVLIVSVLARLVDSSRIQTLYLWMRRFALAVGVGWFVQRIAFS